MKSFVAVALLLLSVEVFPLDSCELLESDGYRDLFEVTYVSTATTGLSGSKPSHVQSYECMKKSQNDEYWFEQLLDSESIAAQMYGLAGLKKSNSKKFKEYVEEYEGKEEEVLYMSGCSLYPRHMSELLPMIVSGSWPRY